MTECPDDIQCEQAKATDQVGPARERCPAKLRSLCCAIDGQHQSTGEQQQADDIKVRARLVRKGRASDKTPDAKGSQQAKGDIDQKDQGPAAKMKQETANGWTDGWG